jgi:hypothetical protein
MTAGTTTGINPVNYSGKGVMVGFQVSGLFSLVNNATISAQSKLQEIQARRSAVSIGDMFEMQMLMNHLSQLSEMATSVVSASNSVIQDMARNVK